MTPKTILVTGGAGFIGSWFIRRLLSADPEVHVINLDALTYAGNLDNLADVEADPANMGRYRFVHGDIGDADLVNTLMIDVDWVVNIAAESHVDRSITGPLAFTQTNVMGTHVLLEAARQANVERFLQVSTDEVYGSLPLDTPDRFDESYPIQPSSPYSASKAASDLLVQSYGETFGMPVLITRCGNNYGPYQFPEKLIPFFIMKAMRDEPLPVYGDGLNVRDWIHVQDHADGIRAVLFKGTPGEVYNLGANNQQANLTMTKTILKALGKPEDLLTYVKDRPGHDRRYAINPTKAESTLGWKAQIPFETGLQETITWYQTNQGWLDGLLKRSQTEAVTSGAGWLKS